VSNDHQVGSSSRLPPQDTYGVAYLVLPLDAPHDTGFRSDFDTVIYLNSHVVGLQHMRWVSSTLVKISNVQNSITDTYVIGPFENKELLLEHILVFVTS
jgi:hypothetical protein